MYQPPLLGVYSLSMGGLFAAATTDECAITLFYGTDYHCHLGTRRGGLAVLGPEGFSRTIHDITNSQFRSKFEDDISAMPGKMGIGCISDREDQPLIIGSHLGTFALATVGAVHNSAELAATAFRARSAHFSEMSGNEINQTELIATLVASEDSFEAGIGNALAAIDGSCTLVILTADGIFAARDRLGRTPLTIGKGPKGHVATMETCALPNTGYEVVHELGPGEVVFMTEEGFETRVGPGERMQICAFLWVYYGYPASSYEGINVEEFRYRNGASMAKADDAEIDCVAGIPDSGIAHALGYAHHSRVPYTRPFVKYTPTWARSFMPQDQSVRDLVAQMKLIPVRELTTDRRLLFCDDSIVRGTQLRDTFQRLYDYGARELHLRVACPPLVCGCTFLNFSRSRSEMDLAARKAIRVLEQGTAADEQDIPEAYMDSDSDEYRAMVGLIERSLGLTSLRYQTLERMIEALGLPEGRVCTYCWTGRTESER